MATATANPNQTAKATDSDVSIDTVDYVVGLDKEGEPILANAKDENVDTKVVSKKFTQTVGFPIPTSSAGLAKIFQTEAALLRVVRIGLKNLGLSKVRQEFLEYDANTKEFAFQPLDGVFDITELLNAEPQRQSLTQREKLVRDLTKAGLPQGTIDTMLAAYDATNSGQ